MDASMFRLYRCLTVKTIFIISLLLFEQSALAQGPGSYVAPSLLFSPGAVANGMGSGLVAASTEASAIYYNPAALARLGQIALEGNTFKLIPLFKDEARYHHLAGAFRSSSTRKLWLGAAYMRAGYGELPARTGGQFEPYESALSFAAATTWGQNMRLGAGVKFVRVNFGPAAPEFKKGDVAASTVAVDLGFLYDGFLSSAHISKQFFRHSLPWNKITQHGLAPGFSFGAALANVGSKMEFINAAQGDPLPQNLRMGLVWNIFASDLLGLVATGEFNKILLNTDHRGATDGALKAIFSSWTDESWRNEFKEAIYSGGFELSLLQLAAIRVGRNWNGIGEFGYNTFGYSIGPPGFRFAFAKYTPFVSLTIDEWRVYTASIVLGQLF